MALELALNALPADPAAPVIVGGVDTYLDLRLLGTLDAEQRILGPRVMDGFIPGEGAAFFVLTGTGSAEHGNGPHVSSTPQRRRWIPGIATAPTPAKGEGLGCRARAAATAGRISCRAPVGTTFAGFNGESFDAKLWGVARLRHNDFFSPAMLIEHPADKYGDAGAATGAILLALAATVTVEWQRARARRWCGLRPIASRAPARSCRFAA